MAHSGSGGGGVPHPDKIVFVNGVSACDCHSSDSFSLVFNYIDGLVLPDTVTVSVDEIFHPLGLHKSLSITARLSIPSRKEAARLSVTMDRTAYGVPLQKIVTERNSFLSIVSRVLMQLRDQVSASEAFAIHQAIKAVKIWTDTGDNPPEHDRLRELIGKAIDRAYRDPQ